VFVDCINVKTIFGFPAAVFGWQGKYETPDSMLACVNVNEELLQPTANLGFSLHLVNKRMPATSVNKKKVDLPTMEKKVEVNFF
jgi:hypothetical protein